MAQPGMSCESLGCQMSEIAQFSLNYGAMGRFSGSGAAKCRFCLPCHLGMKPTLEFTIRVGSLGSGVGNIMSGG